MTTLCQQYGDFIKFYWEQLLKQALTKPDTHLSYNTLTIKRPQNDTFSWGRIIK